MKFYLSIVMLLLGSITINLNAQIPGTQNFVFYSLNTLPLAPLFFAIHGVDTNDRSGWSVSGAGDVNGDGIDDVIVGAPRSDPNGNAESGTSYVVFGRNPDTTVELSDIENNIDNHGFAIHGVAANDRSGWSVSGIGDVNGDGRADVIVGAYQADRSGGNSGSSYVVFDKATYTTVQLSD